MLCRAAVVGRWFSHAAMAAMAQPGDPPLDADLDRLVAPDGPPVRVTEVLPAVAVWLARDVPPAGLSGPAGVT